MTSATSLAPDTSSPPTDSTEQQSAASSSSTAAPAAQDYTYEQVEIEQSDDDDSIFSSSLPPIPATDDDEDETEEEQEVGLRPDIEQRRMQQFLFGYKQWSRGREERKAEEEDALPPLFTSRPPVVLSAPSTVSDSSAADSAAAAGIDTFAYISSLLSRASLAHSLAAFQTEWHDRLSSASSSSSAPPASTLPLDLTPDLHLNSQLHSQLEALSTRVSSLSSSLTSCQQRASSLLHQRDFHRLHHRRVVEEKQRLERDLRRLEAHYASYDGVMERMKREVEKGQKERMLSKIDREKLRERCRKLEDDLSRLQADRDERERAEEKMATTAVSASAAGAAAGKKRSKRAALPTPFPPPPSPPNPFASASFPAPSQSSLSSLSLTKTFPAHQAPVSALSFHPTRALLATASDDCTWKLWSMPRGELVMTGEGHRGWLTEVRWVGAAGRRLCSAGGDGSVKLWDLLKAECAMTYGGATAGGDNVCWALDAHWTGDFVVAAYQDATCRLFDLHTASTVLTLRSHADAVNSVAFLPCSSTLLTASADHTVSLFDLRASSPSSPVSTFSPGTHGNAITAAAVHNSGLSAFTVDADGLIAQWDTRKESLVASTVAASGALYDCSIDRSGSVLATGGVDGVVRCWDVDDNLKMVRELRGHEGRVDAVAWDPSGAYIVSGGADCTFRLWA